MRRMLPLLTLLLVPALARADSSPDTLAAPLPRRIVRPTRNRLSSTTSGCLPGSPSCCSWCGSR